MKSGLKHLNLDAVPYTVDGVHGISDVFSTGSRRVRHRSQPRLARAYCGAAEVIAKLREHSHFLAWVERDALMLDLIDLALQEFGAFDVLTIAVPVIGARHLRKLLEWRSQERVGHIALLRDSCVSGRRGAGKLEGEFDEFAARKCRVRGFALTKREGSDGILVLTSCSMTVHRDYSDFVFAARDAGAATDFQEWIRAEIAEPKCLTERD